MEKNIQLAINYLNANPGAKLTTVVRQFDVPRGRLRSRLAGNTPLTGRQYTNMKLLQPEEKALCSYIDRLDNINLAVRREFVVDAANYILRERASSAQQDNPPTVRKNWIDRFIKRHKYHLMTQKKLDTNRALSESIPVVIE